MRLRTLLARSDWMLTLGALYLSAMGLLFIYSSSYQSYAESAGGEHARPARVGGYAAKQAVWLGAGILAALVVMRIGPARWREAAYPLYLCAILGLVGVLLFGNTIKGTRRWFDLGPISLQPSEFAKVGAILAFAAALGDGVALARWRAWLFPLAVASLPMLLVLKQPDLGTAMLFPIAAGAMLLGSNTPLKRLVALGVCGLALVAAAWTLPPPVGIRPYQRARVTAFTQVWTAHEEDLPVRALQRDLWQLNQSQIAIGAGGMFGRGLLNGTQNRFSFVPENSNDFIFSVIGEEWGFLGSLSVLGAYFLVFWSIGGVAVRAVDPFARNLAVGVGALLAAQAVINAAMTMALFPITGMTLPFVSYGGSSVVVLWACVGIVQGIAARQKGEK
ncbi:MAG: rod shape-determining protein RodA [Planctomycetes bacterium]|nr:rod shape-determining protein RodA [Planctomycetota bacterium]